MTLSAEQPTTYDLHASYYAALVDRMLADQQGFWRATIRVLEERLATRLPGARVLDVACGEGHLGRHMLRFAPAHTTGLDVSAELLALARERGEAHGDTLQYLHGDAHTMEDVATHSVDVAMSHLALMDIPNHRAMFQAVARVLRPGGTFIFSLLHPCFEAPFFAPEGPQFATGDTLGDDRVAYVIRRYATEGQWFSGTDGVRGRMGAHHRTLSTLLNDLRDAGFTLSHLAEPVTPTHDLFSEVPRVLVIEVTSAT